MQTVWKGVISFGLVSIPVQLFAATEEHSVSFRQIHVSDGGQIRYRRVCTLDGEEVPYGDIARGYELPDGQVVVLTDADFAELPLASSRAIEVLGFADADTIDPVRLSRSYYCDPTGSDAKAYVLLREALGAPARSRWSRSRCAGGSRRPCSTPATASSSCTSCCGPTRSAAALPVPPRRHHAAPPRAAGGGGLHPHADRHGGAAGHGRPVPGGAEGARRGQGGRQTPRATARAADPGRQRRQPHGGAATQRRAGQTRLGDAARATKPARKRAAKPTTSDEGRDQVRRSATGPGQRRPRPPRRPRPRRPPPRTAPPRTAPPRRARRRRARSRRGRRRRPARPVSPASAPDRGQEVGDAGGGTTGPEVPVRPIAHPPGPGKNHPP